MPFIDPAHLREFYSHRKNKEESFEMFKARIYNARAQQASRDFVSGGDPISAINAARIALEGDIPLPESVWRWLRDGLEDYIADFEANKPGRSLDKSLGMSALGKGRRRTEDEYRARESQISVVCEVTGIAFDFGISLESAAEMMAARMNDPNTHHPGERVHSAGTIVKYANKYATVRSEHLNVLRRRQMQIEKVIDRPDWFDCQNCPLSGCVKLKAYPPHSLPKELKSRIEVLEGVCTKT